jgi:hypothetical protein
MTHAFSELRDCWTDVSSVWNDDASRALEENHLRKIPAELQRIMAAAQRLTEVLEEAEKECEDRGEPE